MVATKGSTTMILSIATLVMLVFFCATYYRGRSQSVHLQTVGTEPADVTAARTVQHRSIGQEPYAPPSTGYTPPVANTQSKMGIRGSVWMAPDAASGLRIALNSGLGIEQFGEYLVFSRSTCNAAGRVVSEASDRTEKTPSFSYADDFATKELYWKSFCRDFQRVASDFDSAIESIRAAKTPTTSVATGEIIGAAADSPAAAAALIDEILFTRTPTYASVVAANLFAAISPGKSLAHWRSLLPSNLTSEDRLSVLTLAGEHVICRNAPKTCAANTPAVMMSCSRICRPGEDLLSFRRRTTSPMLFEASERIAAEMLKSRAK